MKIRTVPIKKSGFYLSLGLIAASIMYAASQHVGISAHTALAKSFSPSTVTVPSTKTAVAAKKTSGTYADGSYIGSAVDAYYGTVQVKATIQNGQLADVTFLQYPNNRSNSVYINGQAMPMLTQEALAVQSAQVNGVSGATFTSQAFEQSLRSALAQA
jgi:uncharacterized protein with FMN-binding domain